MSYYETELVDHAVKSYFEYERCRGNHAPDQPCRYASTQQGDRIFIRNGHRELALYRWTGKRLVRLNVES
jgi:hypothetical protein